MRSFQDGSLFPTLTVGESIELALEGQHPTRMVPALLGFPAPEREKERQASEIASLMGLEAIRARRIAELSTGTRRIVELACLIALRPAVLLLDEPSSGIAQRESEALGELLARVRDYLGTTLVVIEHDIPLVTNLADRLVALSAGAVIAEGTPEAVVTHPHVVDAYLGHDRTAVERSDVPRRLGPRQRCSAVTRSGARCSRTAAAGDRFCGQHAVLGRKGRS